MIDAKGLRYSCYADPVLRVARLASLLFGLLPLPCVAADGSPADQLVPSENPVAIRHARQFTDAHQVLLLRNTGAKPVEIDRIWSCCGCGASLLSAPVVPPGASVDVLITLNPWSARGKVRKHILVYVKRAELRPKRIEIHADVPAEFRTLPPIAHAGAVERGTARRMNVSVTRLGRERFTVARLAYDRNLLRIAASAPASGVGGVSIRYTVDVARDAPLGPFMTAVRGRCEGKPGSRFGFLVSGRIVRDIRVTPERVVLAGLTPGVAVKKDVWLTDKNGGAFRILEVLSDTARVQGACTLSEDVRHRITLEVDTARAEGNFKAVVTVRTDRDAETEVKIPVLVLLRRKQTPGEPGRPPGTTVSPDTPVKRAAQTIEAYRAALLKEDGKHRVTYPAGGPMKEFSIRNGKLHGTVRTFLENGTLCYEQQFCDGREISFESHLSAAGEPREVPP